MLICLALLVNFTSYYSPSTPKPSTRSSPPWTTGSLCPWSPRRYRPTSLAVGQSSRTSRSRSSSRSPGQPPAERVGRAPSPWPPPVALPPQALRKRAHEHLGAVEVDVLGRVRPHHRR